MLMGSPSPYGTREAILHDAFQSSACVVRERFHLARRKKNLDPEWKTKTWRFLNFVFVFPPFFLVVVGKPFSPLHFIALTPESLGPHHCNTPSLSFFFIQQGLNSTLNGEHGGASTGLCIERGECESSVAGQRETNKGTTKCSLPESRDIVRYVWSSPHNVPRGFYAAQSCTGEAFAGYSLRSPYLALARRRVGSSTACAENQKIPLPKKKTTCADQVFLPASHRSIHLLAYSLFLLDSFDDTQSRYIAFDHQDL
ncbi:hypothetical protein BCR39DRAFT_195114 [Naematelia encephala]|uniref:Uncharacterized protein n=1 Tax=Naematelia encephala TaxID=71784 RepID=A0A1Y2BHP0_9TREE|nr:hypothetical protein BCR39DRAFT_195114 [Naematelia encephala]